jgi:curved DNA-binding protein CbpA
MNAYKRLGLEPRLTITPDELADAFRNAGKSAHPDAGGNEGEFSRLRDAHAILSSPSRRLGHWLGLRGLTVESRGAMDPRVMDMFSTVGAVSQRAGDLIRRREDTKTALGRALLEQETQLCREAVEQAIAMVEPAIHEQCAAFASYEAASAPDAATASTTVRNLAFLEKWQLTLRSLYARLV